MYKMIGCIGLNGWFAVVALIVWTGCFGKSVMLDGGAVRTSLPVDGAAGIFIDSRDGQTYRTIAIGENMWMAENLNFETTDSWCYGNDDSNCAKYGRLYIWDAAMSACPTGWSLPDNDDWDDLVEALNDAWVEYTDYWENADIKPISETGWSDTDYLGFAPLPGGYRGLSDDSFDAIGLYGNWWSTEEYEDGLASHRYMGLGNEDAEVYKSTSYKGSGFSVRCVRD